MHEHDHDNEQTGHARHNRERLPDKMLVMEIAIPCFDTYEAIEDLGEDPSGVDLRDYLAVANNGVQVTLRSFASDEECEHCGERHEIMEAFNGDLVRVRISDTDWILQTADEP